MELVAKVEEEACRLAREATGGGERKVGGNQEVGEVGSVNLSGDGMVVAGRTGVFQDSLFVRSNPDETKGGSVEGRGGGSEVVETEQVFVRREHFGEIKERAGGVADSDDGAGVEGGLGLKIVVRWRGHLGGAKGAHIDYCSLKRAA